MKAQHHLILTVAMGSLMSNGVAWRRVYHRKAFVCEDLAIVRRLPPAQSRADGARLGSARRR